MTGRFTSSRGAIVGRFAVLSREDLGDSEATHQNTRRAKVTSMGGKEANPREQAQMPHGIVKRRKVL